MPTDGAFTRALEESKTDMHEKLHKTEVLIGGKLIEVCTNEELTGICTPKVDKTKESQTVELEVVLTID